MNFDWEVTAVTREVVILKWMRSHECEKGKENKKPPFRLNGGCRFGLSVNRIDGYLLMRYPLHDGDLTDSVYVNHGYSPKLRMLQLINQSRSEICSL